MQTVKEQALLLGPRKSLVAVMSNAVASAARPDCPMVVILNSGIVHRVGSNRMSVSLARALAGAGLTVVRFDLSGIGDSESRDDALPPLEAGLADIREALDSLASSRASPRFILMGLCSGADFSIIYSGTDERVVGVILLEPSIPRTFRHRVYHYMSRVAHGESWLNIVRGKNPFWLAIKSRIERAVSGAEPPPREQQLEDSEIRAYLQQAYVSAIARRVRLFTIFSGENHYYREELLDAFPAARFGEQLRLEFFKDANHMFTSPGASRRLIDLVVDWSVSTRFAPGHDASIAKCR